MALTWRNGYVEMLRMCWKSQAHVKIPVLNQMGLLCPARHRSSQSIKLPKTSLSRPLWPEVSYISRDHKERQHKVVLENVNTLLAKEDYGRLFAVVHFASRQWKVTNEDLILIENHIDAECGTGLDLRRCCWLVEKSSR